MNPTGILLERIGIAIGIARQESNDKLLASLANLLRNGIQTMDELEMNRQIRGLERLIESHINDNTEFALLIRPAGCDDDAAEFADENIFRSVNDAFVHAKAVMAGGGRSPADYFIRNIATGETHEVVDLLSREQGPALTVVGRLHETDDVEFAKVYATDEATAERRFVEALASANGLAVKDVRRRGYDVYRILEGHVRSFSDMATPPRRTARP